MSAMPKFRLVCVLLVFATHLALTVGYDEYDSLRSNADDVTRVRRRIDDDDDDDERIRHQRQHQGHRQREPFNPRAHTNIETESESVDEGVETPEIDEDMLGANVSYANCSACAVRETRRLVRIEMLKQDLLSKLKMSEPLRLNGTLPNITALPIGIFGDAPGLDSEADDDYEEDVDGAFQTLIFSEALPDTPYPFGKGIHERNIVYFKLGRDVLSSTLANATLNVYVKYLGPRERPRGQERSRIRVHVLTHNTSSGRVQFKTRAPAASVLISETDRWYEIGNLSAIVDAWKQRPADNFGLHISVHHSHQNLIVIDASDDQVRPVLKLDMHETKVTRGRRRNHHNNCDADSDEINCCRYPLAIEFAEFGDDWSFVLQPRRFQAFYCAGECPLLYYSHSAHSHLVSLQKDPQLPGGPCCTPVSMSSISMIYATIDGTLVSKEVPNMVVENCGCN